MIELKRLSKAYTLRGGGRKIIADDLTITIPERNVAILGRNGMGKSTLLRLLAGIEKLDSGEIVRHRSISWPIGFRGSFHGELTGLENVRFIARIYGQDTEEITEFVREFSELGSFFYEPVKKYSSGMGARLAFGASMAVEFGCYLIDEVLEVGDAKFRRKSKEMFQSKLASSKMLMVSHSMGSLREYCDCGILVHEGKMTFFDEVEEAIKAYDEMNKQ